MSTQPNFSKDGFKLKQVEVDEYINFPLQPLHPMARIWLYDSICNYFLASTNPNPNSSQLDPQLLLEIYFDEMTQSFNSKINELMGFDFLSFLLSCQAKAQNGFWLDEMLIDLIPQNEFNVLENKREKEEIIIALLKCKTIAKNNALNPQQPNKSIIKRKLISFFNFLKKK